MTKGRKTLRVERDRLHHSYAHGVYEHVRVEEPIAIDLEMRVSYAKDLRGVLERALAEGGEDGFEAAEIAVDLPVRLHLRPIQIEQLIVKLAEITS